jgi:hypothetical protein
VWGILRVVDPAKLQLFALFHRIIIVCVDLVSDNVAKEEGELRDALMLFKNGPVPYVIVALTQVGLKVDLSTVCSSMCRRFRHLGVRHVVGNSHEVLLQALEVACVIIAENSAGLVVPRSFALNAVSSAGSGPNLKAPFRLHAGIDGKNLQWCQGASLFSLPIVDHVCTSLTW